MSGEQRVRAKVTVYTAPREESVKLLLLDESWLEDAQSPGCLACRLWEEGIQGNTKVAIPLRLIPAGVATRKPYGGVEYRRVDTKYVPVPCDEGEVIIVDDRSILHFEKGDKPWIVNLSDVLPRWSLIEEELDDMRCPK